MLIKLQAGYTMTELLVVISVMAILASVVFVTLDDLYQSTVTSVGTALQLTETTSALHTIEDNLTTSSGALATFAPPSKPLGPNNDVSNWQYNDPTTNHGNVALITQAYATTDNKNNPGTIRNLIKANTPDCATSTSFVKNTVIFFVVYDANHANGTLYRRTIKDTNACTTAFQKQTCSASVRSANSSVCEAPDAILLTSVSDFSVQYYDQPTSTQPLTLSQSTAPCQIATSTAIDISITTTRKIGGKNLSQSAATRIANHANVCP